MTMFSPIGRACDVAIDGLRAEFGAVLAQRIIEAEAADFLWEARIQERYLGQQIGWDLDEDDRLQELSRVAILSVLDGDWYAGMCLVDGEGRAVELLWKRQFSGQMDADAGFLLAR